MNRKSWYYRVLRWIVLHRVWCLFGHWWEQQEDGRIFTVRWQLRECQRCKKPNPYYGKQPKE